MRAYQNDFQENACLLIALTLYWLLSEKFTHFLGQCIIFEKESPKSYSKGLRAGMLCRFEVYRTAIKDNYDRLRKRVHES